MLTLRLIAHLLQKLSVYFSKLALFTLERAQHFHAPGGIGWKVTNHTAVLNRRWVRNLRPENEVRDMMEENVEAGRREMLASLGEVMGTTVDQLARHGSSNMTTREYAERQGWLKSFPS